MTERVDLPGGAWVDLVEPAEFVASRVRSPGAHRWGHPGDTRGVLGEQGAFLALIIADWSFHALPVPRRGSVQSLDLIPWPVAEALSGVAEVWLQRMTAEVSALSAVATSSSRSGTSSAKDLQFASNTAGGAGVTGREDTDRWH